LRKHREDLASAFGATYSLFLTQRTQRRQERKGRKKGKKKDSKPLIFFPLPSSLGGLCAFASLRDIKRVIAPWRLCVSLFLLFFLSCTTATKAPELMPWESGIVPLDRGASAYALIDVVNARPILEKISYIPTTDKNVKMIIDKTRSAVLAVFSPSSKETRRYQLVSWGNYPASGSSIAFGTNKDWKKQQSASLKMAYWHSDKAQMSVAVNPSRAYVLAAMTKDPHDPVPSSEGIKVPDGFGEFARGAVFSCWLSEPRSIFNQKLREMGIPLEIPAEQFFVSMFPADGQKYEANILIIVPSAGQARAVANVISFARAFMPSAQLDDSGSAINGSAINDGAQNSAAALASILFANPVVQEGSSLLLKTPPLGVNEIALLFSMFSL
jgi:hypothetical protein